MGASGVGPAGDLATIIQWAFHWPALQRMAGYCCSYCSCTWSGSSLQLAMPLLLNIAVALAFDIAFAPARAFALAVGIALVRARASASTALALTFDTARLLPLPLLRGKAPLVCKVVRYHDAHGERPTALEVAQHGVDELE